jgi:hypothetical protein
MPKANDLNTIFHLRGAPPPFRLVVGDDDSRQRGRVIFCARGRSISHDLICKKPTSLAQKCQRDKLGATNNDVNDEVAECRLDCPGRESCEGLT